MIAATYRITTEHDPSAQFVTVSWEARAVRLADGERIGTYYGETETDAIDRAAAALRRLDGSPQCGHVVFVAADGTIVAGDPRDEGVPA